MIATAISTPALLPQTDRLPASRAVDSASCVLPGGDNNRSSAQIDVHQSRRLRRCRPSFRLDAAAAGVRSAAFSHQSRPPVGLLLPVESGLQEQLPMGPLGEVRRTDWSRATRVLIAIWPEQEQVPSGG